MRKRDIKQTEKTLNQQASAPMLNLAEPLGTGYAFNFASDSFKPKDNIEGTLQSIKSIRKQSLDLPQS